MLERKVFFEIVALHSCQQTIRLKHLVTTCDFDKLCSRSVALQLAAISKNKIIRRCFSRIFAKKIKTPTFQNTFCWMLSLHWKNSRRKVKVFASYCFNLLMLFLMKIRIKESGTLCLRRNEMEDSVFVKTEGAFSKFWTKTKDSGLGWI